MLALKCVSARNPLNSIANKSGLTRLDVRKATGLDGIPASVLRSAAQALALALSQVFNISFSTAAVPSGFKDVMIRPKHKGNDLTVAAKYRPLSICPMTAKVLERLVVARVDSLIDDALLPNQFAYRPGHSTIDALLHATTAWQKALDQGLYVGIVFLDIRKALFAFLI